MSRLDALEEILNRIEQKQHTDEDIQSLRQFLSASDREVAERFAKYNVNIGEGNNIEIGDRTYVEWNQEAVRELIEQIQKQSYAIPLLPKELPQKDYLRLKHLLASGRWREANEQTRVILLRAVNTEENYLNDEQIQNFPCQVLKIIDRLWLKYSNGRFGFSIQKQIFDECKKDIPTFGDRVQWRIQENWISGDRVIYSPNKAPKGHLPWGLIQVGTLDNVFLEAFMEGFKVATKTLVRQDWQLQLMADFMDFGTIFVGPKDFDKEDFKRGMKYELAQEEAWWEGNRVEELKVQKLFSLLYTCPNL